MEKIYNKVIGLIGILVLCVACDDVVSKNRFLSAGIVWEEVLCEYADIDIDSVLTTLYPVLSPDSIEALKDQIYMKYTASRYTLLPSETIDGELYWPIEYTVKQIYQWNYFSDESKREICGYLREDSQGNIYLKRGGQEAERCDPRAGRQSLLRSCRKGERNCRTSRRETETINQEDKRNGHGRE